MEKYTMKDWHRDGSLTLSEGQLVDDEIITELADCLPPRTYSVSKFQPGEPYDHDWNTGRPLFRTFEASKEGWVYVGLRP